MIAIDYGIICKRIWILKNRLPPKKEISHHQIVIFGVIIRRHPERTKPCAKLDIRYLRRHRLALPHAKVQMIIISGPTWQMETEPQVCVDTHHHLRRRTVRQICRQWMQIHGLAVRWQEERDPLIYYRTIVDGESRIGSIRHATCSCAILSLLSFCHPSVLFSTSTFCLFFCRLFHLPLLTQYMTIFMILQQSTRFYRSTILTRSKHSVVIDYVV